VDSLKLQVEHRGPEARDEESPTGFVRVERGVQQAVLLTPDEIDPERRYPLITVFHGAGRREEMLVKAYRDEPADREALFLIPRSRHLSWDLIALGIPGGQSLDGPADDSNRPDLDFLEYAYDLIYRRYPIDRERQALVGYSDGASYGLSLALANPDVFAAAMCWAAGFLASDGSALPEAGGGPAVLLEYGTHDELFPFEQVAVPMRNTLEGLGLHVTFRVDQGGRHWPSGDFQPDALDWFFSEAWRTLT